MRHPGFGTIGNPPDRDPVRPTSDTRPSTLPRPSRFFEWTDDRNDPCAYDVGWEEPEGDPNVDEGRPVWPDGSTVTRLYRFIHRSCEASVAAYVDEARTEQLDSRLLEERPKVAPESESEKRYAAGDR